MDSVRRVEGKAGLVLGEKQGRFQRVPEPGASINYDGGKEKSGVNTGYLLSVTFENRKKKQNALGA